MNEKIATLVSHLDGMAVHDTVDKIELLEFTIAELRKGAKERLVELAREKEQLERLLGQRAPKKKRGEPAPMPTDAPSTTLVLTGGDAGEAAADASTPPADGTPTGKKRKSTGAGVM